jgi:hypothetical protein
MPFDKAPTDEKRQEKSQKRDAIKQRQDLLAENREQLKELRTSTMKNAEDKLDQLTEKRAMLSDRVRSLIDQVSNGTYYGNDRESSNVSIPYIITMDGETKSMIDESDNSIYPTVGEIFVETTKQSERGVQLKVTGGSVIIDDIEYVVTFGKGRLVNYSEISRGDILVHLSTDDSTDITLRLLLRSDVPIDGKFNSETIVPLDVKGKLANEWKISGSAQIAQI